MSAGSNTATFTPLLRVHGQSPNREMWFLGGESDPAYQTELKFDRLRTGCCHASIRWGDVTHHAGTMLRPLVMDFRLDPTVRAIGDQSMFGPAFLVSPITTYHARSRTVYLPKGTLCATSGRDSRWRAASGSARQSAV
jgi:alpha-D-xyloside xylohydrolase